jgi:hypothetical protein
MLLCIMESVMNRMDQCLNLDERHLTGVILKKQLCYYVPK